MREEALCVRQIVKKYLKDNGYDGLWCDECACVTDDIAPCGHIGEDCEAGYKVMRLELAKRPSGFSDQEAAERQEWANATALAVRSYLAQSEGGYVEEALQRLNWLDAMFGIDDAHEVFPRDYGSAIATIRSALRSAKEREAAAVERTVEKAKAAMRELAHPGPGMGTHRPAVSPYALDSILAALDSLKEKDTHHELRHPDLRAAADPKRRP